MCNLEYKEENRIILLDGAMGTQLLKAGYNLEKPLEVANIENPDLIVNIHKDYIRSGANIIYTNTFGAVNLRLKNAEYTLEKVIHKAVENGRRAIEESQGKDVILALDVGPLLEQLEPRGKLEKSKALEMYKEVLRLGERAGVDLVVFETMYDLEELKIALKVCREVSSLPIFTTMVFGEDGKTFAGNTLEDFVKVGEDFKVDAMGINCMIPGEPLKSLIKRLSLLTSKPLILKANAGLPDRDTGLYNIDPVTYGKLIENIITPKVKFVGGCCGTSPEYIRIIKSILDADREYVLDNMNLLK